MEILLENIAFNRTHTSITTPKSFHLCKPKNKPTKNLPNEVLINILSWLPIKSLWSLRFACKSLFNSLTTNPIFSNLHFNRSIKYNPNPSILPGLPQQQIDLELQQRFNFYHDSDAENEIGIDFQFYKLDFSNCKVYGICNGLVCGVCTKKNEIYIWNPFTKEGISIPYSVTTPRFFGYSKMTSFGFGFCQETKEYKVIKLFHESDFRVSDHRLRVSVCTLGVDSSWRDLELEDDMHIPCVMSLGNPVVNGVLHWLGIRSGLFSVSMIVGFDLKDEVFGEISLPDGVDFGSSSISVKLRELGGLLCLFCGYCGIGVEIWAMNEYGVSNSWTKSMRIGRPEVRGSFVYLEPLGFVARTGEIIVQKNLVELIIYYPNTCSIRTLREFSFPLSNVFTFIPSIISPTAFSVSGQIMRPGLLGGRSFLEDLSSDEEFRDAPHASSSGRSFLKDPSPQEEFRYVPHPSSSGRFFLKDLSSDEEYWDAPHASSIQAQED